MRLKNSVRCDERSCRLEGSARRAGSRRHILEKWIRLGNVIVRVIGWWSEMIIGSIVVLESSGRSFCVRKK